MKLPKRKIESAFRRLLLMAVLFDSLAVLAEQPLGVTVKGLETSEIIAGIPNVTSGNASNIQGGFTLANRFPFNVAVTVSNISLPNINFSVSPHNTEIAAGAEKHFDFSGSITQEGDQVIEFVAQIMKTNAQQSTKLYDLPVDFFYLIKNDSFALRDLGAIAELASKDPTNGTDALSPVVVGNATVAPFEIADSFRYYLEHPLSFPILDALIKASSTKTGADLEQLDIRRLMPRIKFPRRTIISRYPRRGSSIVPNLSILRTADGNFKWGDQYLKMQPGWMWSVSVEEFVNSRWQMLPIWIKNTSTNNWEGPYMSDYIDYAGNWVIMFEDKNQGSKKRFSFMPDNAYFGFVIPTNEKPLAFSTAKTDFQFSQNVTHAGAFNLDTAKTPFENLPKSYYAGSKLWIKLNGKDVNNIPFTGPNIKIDPKFYNSDGSVNSIRVVYPNRSVTCAGGEVWTCATNRTDPIKRIYLTEEHAKVPEVIVHELAHMLQSKFWGEYKPVGAGVKHSVWDCHNQGVAMEEGFASFIAAWVNNDSKRIPAPPGLDIETPDPELAYCKNPKGTNEVWNAACFWDLYDPSDTEGGNWNDGVAPEQGDDVGVIKTYLDSKGAESLASLKGKYRKWAFGDTPEFYYLVDLVFKMNNVTQ